MTMCFAERHAEWKDPRVFGMLGLRNITAFAQVSFFYTPADEAWDRWLNPENQLRDLEWLKQQPKGRRGLNLGGWFAHDTFPEWHGREAAKRMAMEVARLFPGEAKPIDLLYIDYEGSRWSGAELRIMLADLLPLCEKAACFNHYNGPGWWGDTGTDAQAKDPNRAKTPIDVGGPELYGAGVQLTRFKRAIRQNPGCVPIYPVCTMDRDWSRIAAWDKVIDNTRKMLEYWHSRDERNRVCMVAPYMLAERASSPLENYFKGQIVGVGRSIEYLSKLDRMLDELATGDELGAEE